ncbi:zinc abc transporter, periplasmic-binding protein znua [Ligilactobacillus ceti DSM 22408]|uniref:Zinc abc transporter, periplasmic-binding protein znua n=1 Tax=Ligilactobacillus ceti DSM 22408 TaxID=1122146 RepID=A0A0R2KSD8_9LACO|nr:zinc ABC transporter substrate-binding protein [Ligilactobacillus ceti]KRN89546.1 zinc abc transporter, periplasmic-binding protein znua [Ligilactobacillus ceti DSM 22408]
MFKKHSKLITLVLSGLAIVLILTGCKKDDQKTKSTNKLQVTATTNVYGQVAKAVLGKHGDVTVLIKGSLDPHDFEPTTGTAKKVHNSDLVVYNGLGYDSWVKKLNPKKSVNIAADVMHKKVGDNEHLWYDSATMVKTANYLAKTYGKLLPKYQADFKKNAAKYIKDLAPLDNIIQKIKSQKQNNKVAVSEPVFDYALENMGYQIINKHFAKATAEGNDPSYRDLKHLQDDIKNKKIAFFVENTQSDSKVIHNLVKLCHESNVPVIQVTETIPKGKTYVSWMVDQDQQILDLQK